MQLSKGPFVSIVITTKNEEAHIRNLLESIKHQTYSNIELILVDNNSTDSTKEIALIYTDKVYNKGPERSAQRNYGMIEVAEGKYVMYLDADMLLSPSMVECCVNLMETSDFVALHVPEIVLGRTFFSSVRRFERRFYDGTVIDAARFFRRDAFANVRGFDEKLSGPEDWDLDKKIKKMGKIGLLKAQEHHLDNSEWINFLQKRGVDPREYGCVIFHNESEFNLRKYLSKKKYYSNSMDIYTEKWGDDDSEIKKQLGAWYRLVGVFIENGKFLNLVLHPALTIGMYYLRLRVAWVYVTR